jgi:hypothetical protein
MGYLAESPLFRAGSVNLFCGSATSLLAQIRLLAEKAIATAKTALIAVSTFTQSTAANGCCCKRAKAKMPGLPLSLKPLWSSSRKHPPIRVARLQSGNRTQVVLFEKRIAT